MPDDFAYLSVKKQKQQKKICHEANTFFPSFVCDGVPSTFFYPDGWSP